MPPPVTLSDRFAPVKGLTEARIDGELALFSESRGAYFGLGSPGTRIFELLDGQRTVAEVCSRLVAEFQVDEATCQNDVVAFLADIERRGLLIRIV